MGGHYGSVQVRSEDHAKVLAAAEKVASAMGIRMLVGPMLKGWIGIYPENNWQDETVGGQLAALVSDHVIQVMVFDDDVFAYRLHHGGKLIDSFNSRPGYFAEEDRATEEAMAGNLQAFESIAPNASKTLTKLFDRKVPRPTYEVETLLNFGKALGIENLITSYEYLKGDEREGIKGWRQFTEIPQSAAREAAEKKRQEKLAIKAECDRLKKAGISLARDERKYMLHAWCALDDGFLACWGQVDWAQYGAKWGKPTMPALPVATLWPSFASSADGKRIAIGTDKIEFWDWSDGAWQHYHNIETGTQPRSVVIHADGKCVSCQVGNQFRSFDAETGKPLFEYDGVRGYRSLSFHPDGQWLLVADVGLRLIPLTPGGTERSRNLVSVSTFSMTPELLAALDKSPNPQAKELFTNTTTEGIHDNNARLTKDGKWLWIRARHGLLVYEWTNILATTELHIPAPRWTFTVTGRHETNYPAYVSTVSDDITPQSLIAGDSLGRLYRFNLIDGTSKQLIQLPGSPVPYGLVFSANQKRLGVVAGIRGPDGVNTSKYVFEVFDFQNLMREAGIDPR